MRVLTDAQWAAVEPLIEECRPRGKTEHHDLTILKPRFSARPSACVDEGLDEAVNVCCATERAPKRGSPVRSDQCLWRPGKHQMVPTTKRSVTHARTRSPRTK